MNKSMNRPINKFMNKSMNKSPHPPAKKLRLLLPAFALAALLPLAACTKPPAPTPSAEPTAAASAAPQASASVPAPLAAQGTLAEYMPIRPNTLYRYAFAEGGPNEDLSFTIYTTLVNGSRVQRRTDLSTGGLATEVLEYSDEALKLIYADPVFYFFEDITGAETNGEMILLQSPLREGATWEADLNSLSLIPYVAEPVETPYGNFDALVVATNFADGRIQKLYYAKGVGVVRMTYLQADDTETVINLVAVEEDASLPVPYTLYAPGPEGLVADPRVFTLATNGDFPTLFEEALKKPAPGCPPLLPQEAALRSISLDRVENLLAVDLSQAPDPALRQGLADTLGRFYDVARVGILANGQPLEQMLVTREVAVDLYAPTETGEVAEVRRTFTLTTATDLAKEFETLLKDPLPNSAPLLGPDVAIYSLAANGEGLLVANFSAAYAGQGLSELGQQCLADTLGQFFGAAYVEIQVEGAALARLSVR
jgi:hypothetical protein